MIIADCCASFSEETFDLKIVTIAAFYSNKCHQQCERFINITHKADLKVNRFDENENGISKNRIFCIPFISAYFVMRCVVATGP